MAQTTTGSRTFLFLAVALPVTLVAAAVVAWLALGPEGLGGGWQPAALFALLGLAVILGIGLLASSIRAARLASSAILQADQNERNQQAILRLLDELGSLADGDLTVEATVTEDITGAIADSINYAIEALRDLVTTINETAIMVDSDVRAVSAGNQGAFGARSIGDKGAFHLTPCVRSVTCSCYIQSSRYFPQAV